LPIAVWAVSPEALVKAGTAAESTGAIASAIENYQAAIKQKPKYGEAYYRLGKLYLEEDSIPQAIDRLTKALNLKYAPDRTRLLLGQAHYRAGQYSEAELEFRVVLETQPRSPEVHTYLGEVYLEKGFYDQALDEFKLAFSIDSTFALAHYGMGNAFARQGKDEAAFTEYDRALRADPDLALVHLARANLYLNRRKFAQAIDELKIYTGHKPRDANGYFTLARAYYGLADTEKALEACRKAKELGLASEEFLNLYGHLAYSAKAYEEAMKALEELIKLVSGDAQRFYDLAKAYYHTGIVTKDSTVARELFKKSIASYNQALTLDSTLTSDIYFDLGLAHYQAGQFDSAVASFTKKIDRESTAAGAYFNRALSHSQAKHYQAAIDDLLKGIEIQPKYVQARIWLAQHYYFLKEYEKARRECNKALELDPNNKDAKELLKNIELATKPKPQYNYGDE